MDPSQREVAAATATYAGSPEHKLPHARSDATLCPADLQSVQPMLTDWIRASILAGWTGGIEEGGYPRYVWRRDGGRYFEGRLTNQVLGEYKGYPIQPDEAPDGLRADN
jgi:hypothetical protein